MTTARPRWRRFGTIALLALLAKLALVSGLPVLPIEAPHDYTNFIGHALTIAHGEWFGPYDRLTLIKGPFFPLFLAAAYVLHLPVLLAVQLLYAAACFAICAVLAPLFRRTWPIETLFVVLLFNPFTYDISTSVINRTLISAALTLLVLAPATALAVDRGPLSARTFVWAAALGLAFSAFSLNREEWIWLVPTLAILLGMFVRHGGSRSASLRRGAVAVLPVALWLVANFAVAETNRLVYGWFTTTEIQSAQFRSAFGSVIRVAHDERAYLIPVPRETRARLYAVSPAFAELKPALEGSIGTFWQGVSCRAISVCTDIGGGFFMWAFRDAIQSAGHYTSGIEAQKYYARLAGEIDDACARGAIRCWPKSASVASHFTPAMLPAIARSFELGLWRVATFADQTFAIPAIAPPRPAILDEYREVVREPLSVRPPPALPDRSAVVSVMAAVGRVYQIATPTAVVLGAIAFGFQALLCLRLRRPLPMAGLIGTAFVLGSVSLLLILSFIDATSFGAVIPEYLEPLYPLVWLTCACGFSGLAQLIRSPMRSQEPGDEGPKTSLELTV